MKKIIHVNQHNIRKNINTKRKKPVLTVKTYKDNEYGHQVILTTKDGKEVARVIYSPDKPLSCGARVWIETDTNVVDVKVSKRRTRR